MSTRPPRPNWPPNARAAVAASREELIAADLDIAVVATTHDALAPISTAALLAGKTRLVRKAAGAQPWGSPAGRRRGRAERTRAKGRLQPPLSPRRPKATRGLHGGRDRPAAEHSGALWPRRGGPATSKSGGQTPEKAGRRRAFGPRGASDRLGPSGSWGTLPKSQAMPRPTSGDAPVEDNAYGLFSHGHRADRLAARELDAVEKPLQLRGLRARGLCPLRRRLGGGPTGRNAPSWDGAIPKAARRTASTLTTRARTARGSWSGPIFLRGLAGAGHSLFAWTGGFGDYRVDFTDSTGLRPRGAPCGEKNL